MGDYLWFIPAKEFLKKATYLKKYDEYAFTSGRKIKDTNKWNDYLIDKRDLGNQINNYLN
jgi:hypothetical protein